MLNSAEVHNASSARISNDNARYVDSQINWHLLPEQHYVVPLLFIQVCGVSLPSWLGLQLAGQALHEK